MKSERWGKMVERYLAKVKGPDAGFLYPHEAVTLLRREHDGVVRAVKTVKRTGKHPVAKIHETPQWMEGYFQACNDVLSALATRKGGG